MFVYTFLNITKYNLVILKAEIRFNACYGSYLVSSPVLRFQEELRHTYSMQKAKSTLLLATKIPHEIPTHCFM